MPEVVVYALRGRSAEQKKRLQKEIDDYGVDFRIDKAELDPTAIEFILQEYVRRDVGAGI